MSTDWREVKTGRHTRGIVDPYYEWAAATNFAYYGNDIEWLPVLIEFQGLTVKQFAQGRWHPRGMRGEWSSLIRIPPAYTGPRANLNDVNFVAALVKREFFAQLNGRTLLSRVIRRFELGLPVKLHNRLGSRSGAAAELVGIAPPGLVVTGIIDDGLAFAHHRFLRMNRTRIEYFWDQVEPNLDPLPNWDYGRELCKNDVPPVDGIDTWLNRCTHAGLVDEEELYRRTGIADFGQPGHKSLARRGAHGTHVMDLACGADRATAPMDRPIICVQLPVRTTEDTSGATLAPQVIDALHYIVDRACRIAAASGRGAVPIVVNLSYATLAGPHDGSSVLETAINNLINAYQAEKGVALRVVLPAGNSYLSRCHARFSIRAKSEFGRPLLWRVLPDDATESSLEIWLPIQDAGGAPPNISVRVISPSGDASDWVGPGESDEWVPGSICCKVDNYLPVETGGRGQILISLPPTASLDPAVVIGPSGTWRIRVRNNGPSRVRDIDAWIQRDDTPYGYKVRGRQSRFDDPRYNRVNPVSGRDIEVDDLASYVRRAGTINAIGTGAQTIVVGGFRRSDMAPVKYSAAGPIVNPAPKQPNGPDALAVTEDSEAHHGLLAAGARSGSVVAMRGTSVAGPQIARWVANDLAAGGLGDRTAVANKAIVQEATPPPRPPLPPLVPPTLPKATRYGAGRIKRRWVKPRPPIRRSRRQY